MERTETDCAPNFLSSFVNDRSFSDILIAHSTLPGAMEVLLGSLLIENFQAFVHIATYMKVLGTLNAFAKCSCEKRTVFT